jgi:hypothetical protein
VSGNPRLSASRVRTFLEGADCKDELTERYWKVDRSCWSADDIALLDRVHEEVKRKKGWNVKEIDTPLLQAVFIPVFEDGIQHGYAVLVEANGGWKIMSADVRSQREDHVNALFDSMKLFADERGVTLYVTPGQSTYPEQFFEMRGFASCDDWPELDEDLRETTWGYRPDPEGIDFDTIEENWKAEFLAYMASHVGENDDELKNIPAVTVYGWAGIIFHELLANDDLDLIDPPSAYVRFHRGDYDDVLGIKSDPGPVSYTTLSDEERSTMIESIRGHFRGSGPVPEAKVIPAETSSSVAGAMKVIEQYRTIIEDTLKVIDECRDLVVYKVLTRGSAWVCTPQRWEEVRCAATAMTAERFKEVFGLDDGKDTLFDLPVMMVVGKEGIDEAAKNAADCTGSAIGIIDSSVRFYKNGEFGVCTREATTESKFDLRSVSHSSWRRKEDSIRFHISGKCLKWDPKDDITAMDIAKLIIPMCLGAGLDEIPQDLMRHFRVDSGATTTS